MQLILIMIILLLPVVKRQYSLVYLNLGQSARVRPQWYFECSIVCGVVDPQFVIIWLVVWKLLITFLAGMISMFGCKKQENIMVLSIMSIFFYMLMIVLLSLKPQGSSVTNR